MNGTVIGVGAWFLLVGLGIAVYFQEEERAAARIAGGVLGLLAAVVGVVVILAGCGVPLPLS